MVEPMERVHERRILGLRYEGFSLLQSVLLALASAFLAFFAATCVAIFALLGWNLIGGHSVSYVDTYRYVGLPTGVLVLVVALPFFCAMWVRGKMRK